MKTKDENKTEVMNYLNKSSKHLFTINGVEHKILIEGDYYIIITGSDISINSINSKIEYYGSNAKCVIKHDLFLIPRYYNREINLLEKNMMKYQKQLKVRLIRELYMDLSR